ncbi:MAG TPA: ion channel [Candidatus Angelobacter sp.]|nr:ion channel [Candidatus Angelobacter sp.]
MLENAKSRPDQLLLASLLLTILLYPVLDQGGVRHALLAGLVFVPVILSTVKLSKVRHRVWPSVVAMSGAMIFSIVSTFHPDPALVGIKWSFLAAFFGLTVLGLFSYLKDAQSTTAAHLYTAVSIYLLLGFLWFALYSAIDNFYPGTIQHNNPAVTDHSSGLLYFSLVTLSTIGYGDVVPIGGEVRMLAALEGMTGVLYVAITIAILVSSYRGRQQGGVA